MNRTPRGRLASRCVSARLYCLTVFGRSLRWSLRNLSTATLIGVRPAFVWSWYSATVSAWAAAWVARATPSAFSWACCGVTVHLFWRIVTEIYSLGEFQSLLHHSAR